MEVETNSAYLLIICNVGKIEKVISQIENVIFIQEIQRTCGAYDIVAKVELTATESLQKFVLEKINSLGDIRSSLILRCNPIF